MRLLANIHRPRRRRAGKLSKGKFWKLRWKWKGERRYRELSLGVSDEQVAREKLAAFKREKEQERWGIIPPARLREGAAKSMADHLADFVAELRAVGRDRMYVYNVEKRGGKLIEGCGWTLLPIYLLNLFLPTT